MEMLKNNIFQKIYKLPNNEKYRQQPTLLLDQWHNTLVVILCCFKFFGLFYL